MSLVDIQDNGCWVWDGPTSGQKEIPVVYLDKKKKMATHRIMYCIHHGMKLTDLKGRNLRRTCNTPNCVNPEHWELKVPEKKEPVQEDTVDLAEIKQLLVEIKALLEARDNG